MVICATGELGSDNFRNNHEIYTVFMISSDVVNVEKKLGHPNFTDFIRKYFSNFLNSLSVFQCVNI